MTASSPTPSSGGRKRLAAVLLAVALGVTAVWAIVNSPKQETPATIGHPSAAVKPALSVTLTRPQSLDWPRTLAANGDILAWREAIIGPEISHYRLTEVLVDVGDQVKKGQLLARISSDTVAAELAQSKAAVAEAEATLAEAKANGDRARQLKSTSALSAQQINQYLTAEQTALARLHAARARVQADELRLSQTRVLAPEAGVISARTAALGSLAQPGQELFRLLLGGRLEWRALVMEAELHQLQPGMIATLTSPKGVSVQGRVRMVAPTVDPQTRQAIVYVDLPPAAAEAGMRAGMFARGEFQLEPVPALTLPQSAVLLRDGFAYVFRLEDDTKVAQTKVGLGRRTGERIEILAGLSPEALVVASGVGFLADGDSVRVVETPITQAKTAP